MTIASIERPFDDLDDPGQPLTHRQRDAADVLAAAVRQLLTVDHGFNDAPPPFTDVYVGDALGGRGGNRWSHPAPASHLVRHENSIVSQAARR